MIAAPCFNDDSRTMSTCDFLGIIRATAIHDDNFISPFHRVDASGDSGFFVESDDDERNFGHFIKALQEIGALSKIKLYARLTHVMSSFAKEKI